MMDANPRQAGFTLIEAVIVLTVLAVLAGLGTGIVVDAFDVSQRVEVASRAASSARVAFARFGRDARGIREASGTEILQMSATTFRFLDADGIEVEWRLDGTDLEREQVPIVSEVSAVAFTYFAGGGSLAGSPDDLRRVALSFSHGDPSVSCRAEVTLRNVATGVSAWAEPEVLP